MDIDVKVQVFVVMMCKNGCHKVPAPVDWTDRDYYLKLAQDKTMQIEIFSII